MNERMRQLTGVRAHTSCLLRQSNGLVGMKERIMHGIQGVHMYKAGLASSYAMCVLEN